MRHRIGNPTLYLSARIAALGAASTIILGLGAALGAGPAVSSDGNVAESKPRTVTIFSEPSPALCIEAPRQPATPALVVRHCASRIAFGATRRFTFTVAGELIPQHFAPTEATCVTSHPPLAYLTLESCDGEPDQSWEYTGERQLRSRSGWCIDPYLSISDGRSLFSAACRKPESAGLQRWTLVDE
jgi:hypothetical protein